MTIALYVFAGVGMWLCAAVIVTTLWVALRAVARRGGHSPGHHHHEAERMMREARRVVEGAR